QVNVIAGMSSCASIDCAQNSGEANSRAGATNAGAPGKGRQSSIVTRKVARTPSAAIASIATRVAVMEYPKMDQTPARYAITPGGWTFGKVVFGTQAPS